METRKAIRSDAVGMWAVRTAAIRAIEEKYYSKEEMLKWSPDKMPPSFEDMTEKYDWLVIEVDDSIVATGALDSEKKSIEAMFVMPDYQKKGFAKKILSDLEIIAKEKCFQILTLESTLAAELFYAKQGYRSVEKSKYHSPSGLELDCIKMEKHL